MLRQVIQAKQNAGPGDAHPVLLRKVESASQDSTCTTDGSDVDISRHLAKAEERQRNVLRSITASSINKTEPQMNDGMDFDISMIENLCSLLSTEGHEVMLVAYRHDLKKCFKFGSETGRKFLSQSPSVMQNFIKFCEDVYDGTVEQVSPPGEVHYNIMRWDKPSESKNPKQPAIKQTPPSVPSSGQSGTVQLQKQIPQADPPQSENGIVPVKLHSLNPGQSGAFPIQNPSIDTIPTPVTSSSVLTQLSQQTVPQPQLSQIPATNVPNLSIAMPSNQSIPVVPAPPPPVLDKIQILQQSLASESNIHVKVVPNPKNAQFKCFVCAEILPSKVGLQQHLMEHSQRWYKCKYCSRLFFRQVDCDRHAVVHAKRKQEKCKFCDVRYVSVVGRNRHMKNRHPEEWKKICQETENLEKKGIKCQVCNATFPSINKMKRHMRYHKKRLINTRCYVCNEEFQTTEQLMEHVKVHPASVLVTCEMCNEKFDSHLKLHQHQSVCPKAVYSCNECCQVFGSLDELERHKIEEGHEEEDEEEEGEEGVMEEESEDTGSLHSLKISSVVSCASDSAFTESEDAQTVPPDNYGETSKDNSSGMASFVCGEAPGSGVEAPGFITGIKTEPEDYVDDSLLMTDIKTEPGESSMTEQDSSMTGMDTTQDSSFSMNETDQSMEYADDIDLVSPYQQKKKSSLTSVCYFCGQVFVNRKTFSTHLKSHMQNGKFKCLYCDYSYTKPDNVHRHMKWVHGKVKEAKRSEKRPILPKPKGVNDVYFLPVDSGVTVPSTIGNVWSLTGITSNVAPPNGNNVSKKSMKLKASEYLPKPWAKSQINFHPTQTLAFPGNPEQIVSSDSSGGVLSSGSTAGNNISYSTVSFVPEAPLISATSSTAPFVPEVHLVNAAETPLVNAASKSVQYQTVSFVPISAPPSTALSSSATESTSSTVSNKKPSTSVSAASSSTTTSVSKPDPSVSRSAPATLCHCLTCNADFTSFDKLQEHMKEHEDKQEYPCHFCQKPFPSLEACQKHMLSAKEVCRFGCEYCGDVMPTRFHLWNHRKIHAKDGRNYSCYVDGCTKRFTSHRVLKKHIVSLHVTNANVDYFDFSTFRCKECGKLFSLKSDLDFHARSHKEKPPLVECKTCGKLISSADKRCLKRHELRHLKPGEIFKCDRELSCHLCKQTFNSALGLDQHLRTVHIGNLVGADSKKDVVVIDSDSSIDDYGEEDKDDDEIDKLTGIIPLDPKVMLH